MNETDFYKKLDEINKNIIAVEKAVHVRLWKSFLDGAVRGVGYLFGVVLALALIGWILNIVGVIPAFKEQVDSWRDLIDKATQQTTAVPKR